MLVRLPIQPICCCQCVFGERNICGTIDGNPIVVVETDQFPQAQVSGQRRGLGGNTFHQVPVGDDDIREMVHNRRGVGPIESRAEVLLDDRHPNGIGKTLAERSGRRFYAGCQVNFWVPRHRTAPLSEIFDIVQCQVVTGEVQERIEQQ